MVNPHKIMQQAASIALMGKGYTKTNPVVGAIIVKDSKVVSTGYHTGFGKPHAEVEAIENCNVDVAGADLYVTLEPCSCYGKTPPCTKKIIERKIKRVFIGVVDPNPENAGKGVEELLKNGVEVYVGFAEAVCASLIEDFAKFIYTKSPFYTIKIAQSIDGKIANKKNISKWITNESSRTYVHYLRSISDAVLVGINTVLIDDPELSVRLITSDNEPFKIVLDPHLKLDENKKLVKKFPDKLIVFTKEENLYSNKCERFQKMGVKVFSSPLKDDGLIDLKTVSEKLIDLNILNVLVEGGSKVFGNFLKEGYADKLNIFVAPKIIGEGVSSVSGISFDDITEALTLKNYELKYFKEDMLITSNLTDYRQKVLDLTEKVRNRCSQGL